MPDPIRCCLLGVCCPPGGKAQREDLRSWLLEKLASIGRAEAGSVDMSGGGGKPTIDQWLDELPWNSSVEDAEQKLEEL